MAIHLHQFDPTATASNNLISNEPHSIADGTVKIIVPVFSLFYSKSLIVKKASNNTILRKGIDYKFQGFDPEISALTGYECVAAISFIDGTFTGNVLITYQCVGGKEGEISSLVNDLRIRIAALDRNDVVWNDVKDKPQIYPPIEHTHNILTDLTGLASIRVVMEKIYSSLLDSRIPVLSAKNISDRIDRLLSIISVQRRDINKLALLLNPATNVSLSETERLLAISSTNINLNENHTYEASNQYPTIVSSLQVIGYITEINSDTLIEQVINNSNDQGFTIELYSSISIGKKLRFLRLGTGEFTITQGDNISIHSSKGLRLKDQFSICTLTRLTDSHWIADGDLKI